MADGADRTERATPKRREEARRQGQVVLSPELSAVAVLLAALALASWGGPLALERSRRVLHGWLAALGPAAVRDDALWPLLAPALLGLGGLLGPFFLAAALVAAGAVVAQVGWSVNPGLLAPDASRLGPAAGLRRLFSLAGVTNLVKAVMKIAVILAVAWRVLRASAPAALAAPALAPPDVFAVTGLGLRRLLLAMALALGALGVLDLFWQRWRSERSLRMSRREIEEEYRESEGDPRIRARFRQRHGDIARRRTLDPGAAAGEAD